MQFVLALSLLLTTNAARTAQGPGTQVPQVQAPQLPAPQLPAPQEAQQGAPQLPAARPAMVVQTRADSLLEERTKAVASQLRCPVCQGLSIQDSPSELARQMRALVKDRLSQGETADQVKAYFVSKYGDWILLEPPASGFNLAVYVLPFVMLIGGAILILVVTRRWSTHKVPTEGTVFEPEDEAVTSETRD